MTSRPPTLVLLLVGTVGLTATCQRAPAAPPEAATAPSRAGAATAPSPTPPLAAVSALLPAPLIPLPAVGRRAGVTVAVAALAAVPPPEAGVSGLLQAVPPLRRARAAALADAWGRVRNMPDLVAQQAAIAKERLEATICDDVVDLRALEGRGLPPFGWRDRVRGRTWATPSLAAVLVLAYQRLLERRPDARLTLGDLGQPGCGPLAHGTLVREVVDRPGDPAATRLVNASHLREGAATSFEALWLGDLPGEVDRFITVPGPLWAEHRILGRLPPPEGAAPGADAPLRLRVATRRYLGGDAGDPEDALAAAARTMRRGVLVRTERVATLGEGGACEERWRQHWVDARAERQVVTVARRKLRRTPVAAWLDEVRLARWQARKPLSFPGEVRWVAERDGARGPIVAWRRYGAVYEAGHVTHLAGIDADISFVTADNASHFAIDLPALDAAATWDWWLALDGAARDLGAEVDRILVDPSVKRALAAALPEAAQQTALWRHKVRLAGGHDAHHHLRLAPPSAESRRRALAFLAGLGAEEVAHDSRASAAASPEPAVGSRPTPSR